MEVSGLSRRGFREAAGVGHPSVGDTRAAIP